METSATLSSGKAARNKMHDERLKQVDDFIKNGGSVTKIQGGLCLEFYTTLTDRQRKIWIDRAK